MADARLVTIFDGDDSGLQKAVSSATQALNRFKDANSGTATSLGSVNTVAATTASSVDDLASTLVSTSSSVNSVNSALSTLASTNASTNQSLQDLDAESVQSTGSLKELAGGFLAGAAASGVAAAAVFVVNSAIETAILRYGSLGNGIKVWLGIMDDADVVQGRLNESIAQGAGKAAEQISKLETLSFVTKDASFSTEAAAQAQAQLLLEVDKVITSIDLQQQGIKAVGDDLLEYAQKVITARNELAAFDAVAGQLAQKKIQLELEGPSIGDKLLTGLGRSNTLFLQLTGGVDQYQESLRSLSAQQDALTKKKKEFVKEFTNEGGKLEDLTGAQSAAIKQQQEGAKVSLDNLKNENGALRANIDVLKEKKKQTQDKGQIASINKQIYDQEAKYIQQNANIKIQEAQNAAAKISNLDQRTSFTQGALARIEAEKNAELAKIKTVTTAKASGSKKVAAEENFILFTAREINAQQQANIRLLEVRKKETEAAAKAGTGSLVLQRQAEQELFDFKLQNIETLAALDLLEAQNSVKNLRDKVKARQLLADKEVTIEANKQARIAALGLRPADIQGPKFDITAQVQIPPGIQDQAQKQLTRLSEQFKNQQAANYVEGLKRVEEANQRVRDSIANNLSAPFEDLFTSLLEGRADFKKFGEAVIATIKKIVAQIIAGKVIDLILSLIPGGQIAGAAGAGQGIAQALGGLIGGRVAAPSFGGIQPGGLAGEVVFVQRGPDLVGVLNRGNSRINRVG